MKLEDKIQLIKDNKDSAIGAIEAYLDSIYNLTDKYFDQEVVDGEIKKTLKEGLAKDEKAESYVLDLSKDSDIYENIRKKLTSDDFNLSLSEIARIGLAYTFISLSIEKQIQTLKEAQKKALILIEKINSNLNTESIDFSEEV